MHSLVAWQSMLGIEAVQNGVGRFASLMRYSYLTMVASRLWECIAALQKQKARGTEPVYFTHHAPHGFLTLARLVRGCEVASCKYEYE